MQYTMQGIRMHFLNIQIPKCDFGYCSLCKLCIFQISTTVLAYILKIDFFNIIHIYGSPVFGNSKKFSLVFFFF